MATLLPINNNENNNNTTKTFVDVNKQTLLVHEYKENNGYIRREITRAQLLKEAKAVANTTSFNWNHSLNKDMKGTVSPTTNTTLPASPIPSLRKHLSVEASHLLVSTIGTDIGIRARDIRKLDPIFTSSNDANILVRYGAIIINLECGKDTSLRALILRNRCYLVVDNGFDSILSTITEKLNQEKNNIANNNNNNDNNANNNNTINDEKKVESTQRDKLLSTIELVDNNDNYNENTSTPYEFLCIETFLMTCTNQLRLQSDSLTKKISKLLKVMKTNMGKIMEIQQKIFMYNEEIQHLMNHADATASALKDVLDSDEDMAYMYLTKLYKNPQLFENENIKAQHEEVEMVLEFYLYEVRGILRQVKALKERLTNASQYIAFNLNMTRNRLQRMELLIASISLIISCLAVVAGIFGMNLYPLTETPSYLSAAEEINNNNNNNNNIIDKNGTTVVGQGNNESAFTFWTVIISMLVIFLFGIPLSSFILWKHVFFTSSSSHKSLRI